MTTHGIGKPYVEIEKQAYWRGVPHTWVNRYVLSGPNPSAADATSVINGLKAIEDKLHPQANAGNGVGFVEGRCYASTGYTPIVTVPYNSDKAIGTATGFAGGTWATHTQIWAPTLETCLLIEIPLVLPSSSGKPVTLKKYMRGNSFNFNEDYQDAQIPTPDLVGIAAACLPWTTGIGGTFYTLSALTANPTSGPPTARPYLVTHQIPRGRKKKKTTLSSESTSALLESIIEGTLATGGEILAGAA